MNQTEGNKQKLSVAGQFGYFCGDFGGSIINLYVSAFYLTFCTYVLGIKPGFMSILFFAARIWDAINDPLIGSLPDRFTIGKGADKFKPWIKVFMIPLAVSGLICFADISSFPGTIKHVWVVVAYVLYGMAYTGVSMPYGAMASVITDDPIERAKLSRARAFGGIGVGMLFLPVVSLAIWDKHQNPVAGGYFLMAVVGGLLSIGFYIVCLTLTKERIHQTRKYTGDTEKKYSLFHVLAETFTNRAMLGAMLASIGSMFVTSQSMQSFLYREFYHAPKAMALNSMIGLPATFLAFFAIPRLAKMLGNRKLIIIASAYSMITYGILYFVVIPNVYAFMAISSLAMLGNTTFIMLVWALVTEAIDYQEYKSGERSDGTMYSIYTFSRKIGSACSASVSTALIGVAGYVVGAQQQIPGFGENIRKLMMALPMCGSLVILIGIGLVYPLNKKRSDEMYGILKEKHRANAK